MGVESLRRKRARIASHVKNGILICSENPLFDYFAEDHRADCIQIMNGRTTHIGDRNISEQFSDPDPQACILEPYFGSRKQVRCDISAEDIFQFPLEEETKIISETRKRIEELVISVLSEGSKDMTELYISEAIRRKMCAEGLKLFYEPVVSFDRSTDEIWHRPDNIRGEKIGYVEVACNVGGLASLFSETFLFVDEEPITDSYRSIMKATQIIRNNFTEGSRTSLISQMLEGFRNERLYLTNPLYPFKVHLIPGDDEKIKTGDAAVFDIWVKHGNMFLRKKIMAVAGSFQATIL